MSQLKYKDKSEYTFLDVVNAPGPATAMIFISIVTLGTGFIIWLPAVTTFTPNNPSWDWLRSHGGESLWGPVINTVGVLCMTSTWLYVHYVRSVYKKLVTDDKRRAPRRYARFAFQIVAPMWICLAGSFLLNNPTSLGSFIYVCIGALAQWVSLRLRRNVE